MTLRTDMIMIGLSLLAMAIALATCIMLWGVGCEFWTFVVLFTLLGVGWLDEVRRMQ